MQRASSLLVALAVVACGKTQRGEPNAPELRPATVEVSKGHPNGAGGLGPAMNDKLPEVAIRLRIRSGIGTMPKFGEEWLSDDDVAAIAEYLQALRGAKKSRPKTASYGAPAEMK